MSKKDGTRGTGRQQKAIGKSSKRDEDNAKAVRAEQERQRIARLRAEDEAAARRRAAERRGK